jgi:hypothetical protein
LKLDDDQRYFDISTMLELNDELVNSKSFKNPVWINEMKDQTEKKK